MRPRKIKVHPINYVPKKSKLPIDHKHETLDYVQTVHMANGQTRAIKHYVIHQPGGLSY